MRAISLLLTLALLPQTEIRVDVRLQQLTVTVRDGQGNLVKNLRAEDFILEEGGTPQTIAHFVQDNDTPVSMGILIDVSGSMAATPSGSITALRAAEGTARLLLHLMKPQDEFVLMSFSDGVKVEQNFTGDRSKIEKSLSELQTRGGTDLQEGVEKGLRETRKGKHRKKALIVITDAYAVLNSKSMARAIQESEILVYTFGLQQISGRATTRVIFQPGTDGPSQEILDLLASESGGRSMLFEMHSEELINRMIRFVQDIATELRGQYLIGYYPQKPGGSVSQAIRIRTKSPAYQVRYRREALAVSQ
jgi:Ca-activated chloride channel family protein